MWFWLRNQVVHREKSPITLPYFQGNKDLLKTEYHKVHFRQKKQPDLSWEENLKLRFSGGKNLNYWDICLPLLKIDQNTNFAKLTSAKKVAFV